jgi:hypothetical protein
MMKPELPTPERETVCGLFVPESVKLRVAVRVPAALGLKTMVALQAELAAKLVPQVLPKIVKSAAFVPETPTLLIVMADERPFVSCADWDALLVPTAVPG